MNVAQTYLEEKTQAPEGGPQAGLNDMPRLRPGRTTTVPVATVRVFGPQQAALYVDQKPM